jgi:drug/metabolite transporter (DMT)-like permease
MTVQELFDFVGNNPMYILYYFIAIPILAGIVGLIGDDKCKFSPWREFFMIIIYAVMIPGIFAFFFNLYLFLFENHSILNFDILIQILPIVSMIVTLLVIKRYVRFDEIPGFDKISGLVLVISAIIMILWIADKFRIVAFTYMPFHYFIIIFLGLLIAINWGIKKLLK